MSGVDLTNNLSAVLYGIDDIRLENRDVSHVGKHDVLLEMACVGICGSDVHYWKHGRIADFILKEPMVLGHEASGIVRKVGAKVKHLKEGDRVAIEPGYGCFRCSYCVQGRYNLCPSMKFCATPPYHGNLSRYYVHCADFCYKLPDHVSLEEGALLEPISVGVHACKRAGVTIGKNVLILGSGPIGLVTSMVAQFMGARKVLVTDLNEKRLQLCSDLGASTFQVTLNQSIEEFRECVKGCLGDLPDITIDCGGFEATISQAIKTTKPGGVVVLVGMGGNEVMNLPIQHALIAEIDIRGTFRYCNDYKDTLAMVSTGKMDFKRLITAKFNLEQTVEAFEETLSGQGVKVMIYCQKK